jgi:hypothetical protein
MKIADNMAKGIWFKTENLLVIPCSVSTFPSKVALLLLKTPDCNMPALKHRSPVTVRQHLKICSIPIPPRQVSSKLASPVASDTAFSGAHLILN